MIEPRHPALPVSRQCTLVGISRPAWYGPRKGENPLNLGLMRWIDAQFLETPWYGSRQMARHLRRQGHVGRKRVRRLMGDCQEFRVVPGIVGSKEPRYAATQRTEDF
jgi:putative transposase